MAYTHSGTSPTQAEIINLTRNVKITAYDTTAVGYIQLATSADVDVDWTEFSFMGENASGKHGVNLYTTTGSASFTRCSFYNFEDFGIHCEGTAVNNFTFSYCVGYALNTVNLANTYAMQIDATSGTTWTVDNFRMIYVAYNDIFRIKDLGGTFTNNRATGSAYLVGSNLVIRQRP